MQWFQELMKNQTRVQQTPFFKRGQKIRSFLFFKTCFKQTLVSYFRFYQPTCLIQEKSYAAHVLLPLMERTCDLPSKNLMTSLR